MILVSILYNCLPTKRWRWHRSAHLFCDSPASLNELHEFAAKLDLKRSWFQNDCVMPHYDLTYTKRKMAISHGAIPVNQRAEVKYLRVWRYIEEQLK